ncbi:MAG: hypothetical protein H6R19_3539 [Proteobacteria bacterium]|nr:hypothetical protein [Pseudomonadota bacterium]
MSDTKKRDFILGLIMLAVGLGYMFMASQLKLPQRQFTQVNAAFVPYLLATILCILGVLQMREARKPEAASAAKQESTADYSTVLKTLGLIIAYAALLQPVGFPLMTIVYLFLQFIVLTPSDKQVSYPLYATIAVLTSVIVYAIFRYAFDMILPLGPLSAIIN